METSTNPGLKQLPETIANFNDKVASCHKVKLDNLRQEYLDKANAIKTQQAKFESEQEIISLICLPDDSVTKIEKVEEFISQLNSDLIFNSSSIMQYNTLIGPTMLRQILCEVVTYFVDQLQVSKSMSGEEIYRFVIQVTTEYRQLRLYDFFSFLSKGIRGEFGTNYNRMDIQVIWEWLAMYIDGQSQWLETKYYQEKPNSVQSGVLTSPEEKQLKAYRSMLREQTKLKELENKRREHTQKVRDQAKEITKAQ